MATPPITEQQIEIIEAEAKKLYAKAGEIIGVSTTELIEASELQRIVFMTGLASALATATFSIYWDDEKFEAFLNMQAKFYIEAARDYRAGAIEAAKKQNLL